MTALVTPTAEAGLAAWHELVRRHDPGSLPMLLAPDVVFRSPVEHRPYVGAETVGGFLLAALQVVAGPDFQYVREVASGDDAVLEFTTTVGDRHVNGIDMIRFGPDGRIVEFTVMLRPLSATQAVREAMAALLGGG